MKIIKCTLLIIAIFISCVLPARSQDISQDKLSKSENFGLVNTESIDALVKIPAYEFKEKSDDANVRVVNEFNDYYNPVLEWTGESGSVTWEFNIPVTGQYELHLEYFPLTGYGNPIELSFLLNDTQVFDEMDSVFFPRYWEDAQEIRIDRNGNEFAPEQSEIERWITEPMIDDNGLFSYPFRFILEEGINTVTVSSKGEPLIIGSINFVEVMDIPEYQDWISENSVIEDLIYKGDQIYIQGESANIKTTRSLVPKADNSSPSVYPSDPYRTRINYIGSYNWQKPTERLTWEFDVPEDGYYNIGFGYRQYYLRNIDSYRKLTINGKPVYTQTESIGFPYTTDWSFLPVSDGDEPLLFYLEKGKNNLSLEVTLGPMADFSRAIEEIVFDLGELYRSIVMITGDVPDASRDYNLFGQIPQFKERLENNIVLLNSIADQIQEVSGTGRSSEAIVLSNMADVMQRMLDFKFRAQDYKRDFYNSFVTVSSWMFEMRNMPLDLDEIVIYSPSKDFSGRQSGFFDRVIFSIQRFIASFVVDYNTMSAGDEKEGISVWVNWGRDQAQVLYNLTNDLFTAEEGIPVTIRLVNASLIQAILSGEGPDCTLMLSRTQPVNLAMRDALHDLSEFSDFEETIQNFMPGATVPYEFDGGYYGLPDSQQFFMMFYRSDILEELGLVPPETWQEFFDTAAFIQRRNLHVGIPYVQVTDIYQTDAGIGSLNLFPTFMLQFGVPIYNSNNTATNLTSPPGLEAFTFWTNIYTQYKFPITYDFYSRFRTGEMVIGIAPYMEYSRLMAAAPDIYGRWGIAMVPGLSNEDGTINRSTAGSGTASVILKISQNKDNAWEYLKWWTSANTQQRYATEIESLLGIAGRHPTANVDAFSSLPWKSQDRQKLLKQWENVSEIPEIPGGYFLPRAVDQAFWNVVYNSQNPRETLITWSLTVDAEIARKRMEYGLDK